ncbi:hypothetical protein PG996_008595 [Apiospora saccharicola]|uniref:Uncharacterized protein n=1 Tax=Apiospora saccharicola TaxID=335842 RepID=A0ABR1UYD3_9PEZI
MTWPLNADLTVEEQLGILALITYLNAGIAWYCCRCRKSEFYKDFERRVIGQPPPPPSLPSSPSSHTDTTAQGPPAPSRFAGTGYALKRWGFVTASVLFWAVHALIQLADLLRKVLVWLGALVAGCAYVAYELAWGMREVSHAKRDWGRELAVDATAGREEKAMPAVPRPAVLHARAEARA